MSKIKWNAPLDKYGENQIKQHAFRSAKRLKPVTAEPYIGNRSLCTSRIQITKEGPVPLTIDEIENEKLNKEKACKKCMKIAGVKYD